MKAKALLLSLAIKREGRDKDFCLRVSASARPGRGGPAVAFGEGRAKRPVVGRRFQDAHEWGRMGRFKIRGNRGIAFILYHFRAACLHPLLL
jgi:hypothetical protein